MKILVEKAVIEQALEALGIYGEHARDCPQYPTYTRPQDYPKCACGYEEAIAALREALAEQAEQEPILSYHVYDIRTKAGHEFFYEDYKWHRSKPCGVLNQNIKLDLYAAPVRTKDLTDDEILAFEDAVDWSDIDWTDRATLEFARAVIAADREKNR